MGSLPQPIPIVNLSGSSCTLLRSNVDVVLAKVGRCPVFPISINGKIRSGKSSLMNKVIRDLEARQGNRNLDPAYGFPSRGGKFRETVGINLWPIPYFITIAGEEVAVLLLDTQGLYDGHTSPRQNVLIPTINSLLSSVMLFNYKCQVDDEDFKRIREFSKFASSLPVVLQDAFTNPDWSEGTSVKNRDGAPLSKLNLDAFRLNQLIIIERNSPLDEQFSFGIHDATRVPEGSPQNWFRSTFMLDDTNAPDENSEFALEIRHGILCNFKDVKMCLLPHPGQAFVDQREGEGVGPSDQFNDTVQLLIETMLSRGNVLNYKFSVHELRDRLRIINLVCDNVDVYLTDAASEEEMTRYWRYSYAETNSISFYGEQMTQYLFQNQNQNQSVSQEQLERAHRLVSEETMTRFRRLRGRRDAAFEEEFTAQVERRIGEVFRFFEARLREAREADEAASASAADAARRARNRKILFWTLCGVGAVAAGGFLGYLLYANFAAIPWVAIGERLMTWLADNHTAVVHVGVGVLAFLIKRMTPQDNYDNHNN